MTELDPELGPALPLLVYLKLFCWPGNHILHLLCRTLPLILFLFLFFYFYFPQKTMHLNAIGNRNVSYNQESFVTAYYDVLIHGPTITKAGFQQNLPLPISQAIPVYFPFLSLWTTYAHIGCNEAFHSQKASTIWETRNKYHWDSLRNWM